jgi:acyl-CoA thioester hydrolase
MYEHRAQLRFSDTDAMGHINHARFATIFEDARIGLLRHIAGGDDDLAARGIILARLEIDYLRPLMLDDDPVLVRARVVRIGTRSFSIDYELEQRGEVCARGMSVLVAYDYAAAGTRPLTAVERGQLERALEVVAAP